ncbi:hypothetical protein GCM10018791_60170 [Streptomyces zaomyceticus]|nr:hypothetical protein GCM10018791_60170 [Streptomyces zaomyceticus]
MVVSRRLHGGAEQGRVEAREGFRVGGVEDEDAGFEDRHVSRLPRGSVAMLPSQRQRLGARGARQVHAAAPTSFPGRLFRSRGTVDVPGWDR